MSLFGERLLIDQDILDIERKHGPKKLKKIATSFFCIRQDSILYNKSRQILEDQKKKLPIFLQNIEINLFVQVVG
jgi:hypothetical protein